MTARFAPTDIGADLSGWPAADRQVLAKLVAASKVIDALFLRQVWAGNQATLIDLAGDTTAEGRARLRSFLINKGPWSRLDHNEPFVPGAPPKPSGANFYPADATKEDVERWMSGLPEGERRRAAGFFHVVRRSGSSFSLVPYSQEYQNELAQAAMLLRDAAGCASEPSLRRYLESRAAAFQSNDYYESDVAWMEIAGAIEPTIGPYEVYEDEWFNYKAAFESFVAVRDETETARLQVFAGQLQDIEDHLPIEPRYRNQRLGGLAPIVVVNEVFAAGDANHGVQTAAFNLPNDERVVREMGSKRVMFRNVQDAKFTKTLVPIARIVLAPEEQAHVVFDAFFTHIVVHELMHGLGPHVIRVNGMQTTVRRELKDTYSAIEEAKADISALFALSHLMDKGVLPRALERPLFATFLASTFRSLRFGINEAHGRAVAIQLNHLLDAGGVVIATDGTFAVDLSKAREAVTTLTREIMTLQAEGNYDRAKAMRDSAAVVRPAVQHALDRLGDVPVDIAPRFVTAEALLAEFC